MRSTRPLVSPSSPSSIAAAMRSRTGSTITRPTSARSRRRRGRLHRRPHAAARRTRRRSRRRARRPTPRAARRPAEDLLRGRPALVAPHRVEQRVLVVLGRALGPLGQRRPASGSSDSACRARQASAALGGARRFGRGRRRLPASGIRLGARPAAGSAAACGASAAIGSPISSTASEGACAIAASAWPARIRAKRESTSARFGSVAVAVVGRCGIVAFARSRRHRCRSSVVGIDIQRFGVIIGRVVVARSAARASTCASAPVASRKVRFTTRYASSRWSRPPRSSSTCAWSRPRRRNKSASTRSTRRLGLVEHVASLLTCGFDQLLGLTFGALGVVRSSASRPRRAISAAFCSASATIAAAASSASSVRAWKYSSASPRRLRASAAAASDV